MRTGVTLLLLSGLALLALGLDARSGPEAPESEPETAGAATEALPGYTLFVHPLGFRFQRPSAWRMQQVAQGMLIVPPDAGSNATGPTELYLVTAAPVPADVVKPDDVRIRQHLDSTMRGMLPFLRLAGEAVPISARGRTGAVTTWTGEGPTGMKVVGKVYGLIEEGYLIGISAVAETSLMAKRQKILETVFSTCAVGKPVVDARMLGVWYHQSTRAVGLGVNKTYVSSTRTLALLPDGTIHAASQTLLSGRWQRAPGSNAYDSLSALVKGFPDHGRWGAANGQIYMIWADGTTAGFALHVQGAVGRREALLTAADGTKQLWTETAD